ncbi:CdaR family transcriptional regulator [Enterococcus sp. 22-H-5-01]|uniref:CdaR family transcriptional regulator n=1 Tax=Enterococcus TaxID=1350 RepID=UPI002FC7A7F5
MSNLLTTEQANLIVKKLMADIPYNINIMNEHGYIIASGKNHRIGERHRGAERAIKQKAMVEIFKDTSLEKRGTNEPIILNGELLGVVGISGDPAEVRPFTKLVKSIVLLLIEELNEFSKKEKKKQQRTDFIKDLFLAEGTYGEELERRSLENYGINLLRPNRCVLATEQQILRTLFPLNELFEWRKKFLIFIDAEVEVKTQSTKIIVSSDSLNLSRSMRDVENTFLYLQFSQIPFDHTFFTEDVYFAHLFDFPIELDQVLLKKVNAIYDEYYETIVSFANNSTNVKAGADQLQIHRNTLNYRIERIHKLTQKDPRSWSALWTLMYHFAYCFKQRN